MTGESAALLRGILRDDALTRGLGDIEARMLVDWLAAWAELFAPLPDARNRILSLYRRARAIARFVQLWCDFDPRGRGAAGQLAAAERFSWPLPTCHAEPPDLMRRILDFENQLPE